MDYKFKNFKSVHLKIQIHPFKNTLTLKFTSKGSNNNKLMRNRELREDNLFISMKRSNY